MTALTVTHDGDVLHIDLIPGADGPDTEGEEVTPGVVLLYDGHGWLIGIEINTSILREAGMSRWSDPPEADEFYTRPGKRERDDD